MKTTRRGWPAEVAFSLALLAYPRAFRRRFGDEMRADFSRTPHRHPGTPGTLRTLGTLFVNGLAERKAAVIRWVMWPGHAPHLYEPTGRHAMFWDNLRSDLRHALRLAAKSPVFTALTVLALALGIGANSAIFTAVNSVLLQPLPYRDPGQLVMVWTNNPKEQQPEYPVSPANFIDYRKAIADVADLEAFQSFISNDQLRTNEGPEKILTVSAGPRMFSLLGRDALVGRVFTPDDTDVAVISYGFWQRRFGGDRGIVGQQVTIGSTVRTIVGVMPDSFTFPYNTMLGPSGFTTRTGIDVWLPWVPERDPFANRGGTIVRNVYYLALVARMKPGVTLDGLRARLDTVAGQLAQAYPAANAGMGVTVVPLHEQAVGSVESALLVLLAGVGVVLLMASVNVANLALTRSVARQRELAVRAALGAGRGRLIRQALVESLLLALAGSLAALLLARWGVAGLQALAPRTLPRLQEIHPDARVLGFTLVVGVIVGVAVGLVPAWAISRANVRDALHDSARGAAGASSSGRRLRAGLVVAEVALAVVLTVGAGLLLRSFSSLLAVDPGFKPEGLLTMQMELPGRIATPEARLAYYDELFERITALPGVMAAGGTTRLPLGSTSVSTSIDVEGRPLPDSELPEVQFRRSLDDYFQAMGVPLRRGRLFTRDDGPSAPPVAIINDAMAARLFPNEDPVGKRIRTGPNPSRNNWITIVGVVGNIRHTGLEDAPAPEMYISHRQGPPVAPFLVVRTSGDPAALAETLRADLRGFDRALALYDIRTMMDVRSESVSQRRFILWLVGAFGALALGLAAIGVYGVMSLIVSERTREVGLRLALGAEPSRLLAMIVGQAAKLGAIGVAVGLAIALPMAPLLDSQLYGITSFDPMTFFSVPVALLAIAVLAAIVPARKAMRTDPLAALRIE